MSREELNSKIKKLTSLHSPRLGANQWLTTAEQKLKSAYIKLQALDALRNLSANGAIKSSQHLYAILEPGLKQAIQYNVTEPLIDISEQYPGILTTPFILVGNDTLTPSDYARHIDQAGVATLLDNLNQPQRAEANQAAHGGMQ